MGIVFWALKIGQKVQNAFFKIFFRYKLTEPDRTQPSSISIELVIIYNRGQAGVKFRVTLMA